jgi:hypothetical protein
LASTSQTRRSSGKSQKGALMAGVVAMIAVSLVWSAVAFQAWIDVLRRDNEAEMIFRAEEIVRAIQRYRRDHGGQGPPKLKELLEMSPKRSYYIRREYDDPLVANGKWGLLYMGPGGAIVDPSDQDALPGMGLPGGAPAPGSSGTSLDQALGQGQSGQGSTSGQGQDLAGTQSGTAGLLGGVGNRGDEDGGIGLPIAGVKSLCTETPFRVYKGESQYEKWLFTYLDLQGPGGAAKGKGSNRGQKNTVGGQVKPDP